MKKMNKLLNNKEKDCVTVKCGTTNELLKPSLAGEGGVKIRFFQRLLTTYKGMKSILTNFPSPISPPFGEGFSKQKNKTLKNPHVMVT